MWGKRNRKINTDLETETQTSETMSDSCSTEMDLKMNNNEKTIKIKNRPHAEHILQPDSFRVTKPIADELLQRRVVIIDFSKLPKSDRTRTIDFVTGVTYAHNGRFKKISNQIYKFELK